MLSRKGLACIGALTGLLLASGCDSAPQDDEPAPGPIASGTDTPAPDEPVSIIRPDAEVARQMPPLEPLAERIPFGDGGSVLGQPAIELLQAALDTREMAAGGQIVLRGHTDSDGNDEANLRASQRRAEAVRDWLVQNGVAEDRIRIIAMGEQNPARPNANPDGTPNEDGRAFNRRVDLVVSIPEELAAPPTTEASPTLVEQVTSEE